MSNEETKNEDAQDVDAKGTPRVIVYVGLRLDQKDVAYHMYAVLSDEEVTLGTWRHIDPMCNGRKVLAFRKPLGKYIGIGKAIHAIEFPDNKWRVSYDDAGMTRSLGYVDDTPRVAWVAESNAFEATRETLRQEKKERARDLIEERLTPLKEVYARLRTRKERAAFLGRIIVSITGRLS